MCNMRSRVDVTDRPPLNIEYNRNCTNSRVIPPTTPNFVMYPTESQPSHPAESPTSVLLFDATALNLIHQPEGAENKDPNGHKKEKKRKVKKKKKGGGRRKTEISRPICTKEAGRRHERHIAPLAELKDYGGLCT